MIMADSSRLAVLVIIVTVFALALGDAIIKGTSATFSLWQIFVLRSLAVVPILVLLVRLKAAGTPLVPVRLFWTLLRSFLLTLMWVTYYLSLAHVELSIAAATYYTLPLFITLLAALFLRDPIGPVGWLAIALGFIGVILILEPRASDFNWYALLPLISAVLYAIAMILTRSRCRVEHMFILSLWLNLTMLAVGAIMTICLFSLALEPESVAGNAFLFGPWSTLGASEWFVLSILAVAILVGSIGAAYAYQNGRPSTIATFDFAYVAFAMMWGIIAFNEVVSARGLTGAVLILIAGILAVRNNGRSKRAAK